MNSKLFFLVDKYSFIVDGTAEKKIDEFIAQNKTFDEFVAVIIIRLFKN
jgi:hypothetical protein